MTSALCPIHNRMLAERCHAPLMKLGVFTSSVLLGLLWNRSYSVEASSIRWSTKNGHRTGRPCSSRSDATRLAIPKILHHVFLDGEAAYWRNATLGDDFTPAFYPRTKEKGDKNATFKHEWKTGCQHLMPDWRVHYPLKKLTSWSNTKANANFSYLI